ncbi:MAG: hypothetical protein QNL61_01755 [Crocinitomicaceae bacterium]
MKNPVLFVVEKCIYLAFVLIASISISSNVSAQKNQPFIGMLEYKISVHDTAMRSLFPENSMIIYSNDTISRIENFTSQLGKQVVLRHMEKKKSYLLLDSKAGKFAIRTDQNKSDAKSDSTTAKREFTFQKKMFKRKIVNRKANRIMVSHPEFEEPIEFLYFKKISNKYSTFYTEMPGLPVKFSVPTADGIVDYELVKMSEYKPNYDLFGVPDDYELVTFDEFLEKMIGEGSKVEE